MCKAARGCQMSTELWKLRDLVLRNLTMHTYLPPESQIQPFWIVHLRRCQTHVRLDSDNATANQSKSQLLDGTGTSKWTCRLNSQIVYEMQHNRKKTVSTFSTECVLSQPSSSGRSENGLITTESDYVRYKNHHAIYNVIWRMANQVCRTASDIQHTRIMC